jgi:integrase
MDIVYKSILKDEIAAFSAFIKLSVADSTYQAYKRTLIDFDHFLYSEAFTEKRLDAGHIGRWLDSLPVHIATRKSKLSHLKRFSEYLFPLGIPSSLPELPRKTTEFKPYVFTADEMSQIFEAADDLILERPKSRVAAEFPLMLRILYGCGLRLGEAVSLTWDCIDLAAGVMTIKVAKNRKQRIVPMGDELTRILKIYQDAPCFGTHDNDGLVFKKNNGEARTTGAYWSIFNSILGELGIKNHQTAKYGERGPCIHSLRHSFTLHSLLKAEAEGRGFMDTVPFLSTYLGHEGLMHTDKYLKARHELYTEAHAVIAEYTLGVFPQAGDVFGEDFGIFPGEV